MAERETERVVVANDGGGGSGTAVAVVLGIIVLLIIAYFAFGRGMLNGGTHKIDANVKVDAPAKTG